MMLSLWVVFFCLFVLFFPALKSATNIHFFRHLELLLKEKILCVILVEQQTFNRGSVHSVHDNKVRNTHMARESHSSHRTLHSEHLQAGVNNSFTAWPWTLHCLQVVRMEIKGIALFAKHSTSGLTTSCRTWMERPAFNSRLREWLTASVGL